MSEQHDIELIIKSHIPIVAIQSHEELRATDLLKTIGIKLFKPVFRWTVTEGLQRLDLDLPPQKINSQPTDVLQHIKAVKSTGVYILTDFHPYLDDPVHVRLLKDIALSYDTVGITIVLLSHELKIPPELVKYTAQASLKLPNKNQLDNMIRAVAQEWTLQHNGETVKANPKSLDMLINNLAGLTMRDAKRLARNAIYDDGAISENDIPKITQAKYQLLSKNGILSFEYDTARFSEVGGFSKLKNWLTQRSAVFHGEHPTGYLDAPKGVMLLGVQGCGKSLAAKAVAGTWGVPLLRLDFGTLYNKFYGETERNLRDALKTAEVMEPCILWIDEIEKSLSTTDNDGGTSQRVLGTLLTWMAEKKSKVFLVATANNIDALPPELVRKGRFDEIFFVDLPNTNSRETIFSIHLQKRGLNPADYQLGELVKASDGFSGAEIEQVIVSAMFSAHANKAALSLEHLVTEIHQTRPLSVVMAEKINGLRTWAADRTVPCD